MTLYSPEIAAEGKSGVSIPITAPRSGVVLERMAVEGMMSKAGEALFRIADTSTVRSLPKCRNPR